MTSVSVEMSVAEGAAGAEVADKRKVERKDKEVLPFVVEDKEVTEEEYRKAVAFGTNLNSMRLERVLCRISGIEHELGCYLAAAAKKAMDKKDPTKQGGRYPKGIVTDIKNRLTRAKIVLMEEIPKVEGDIASYKDKRAERTKRDREARGKDPDAPVGGRKKEVPLDPELVKYHKEIVQAKKEAFERATALAAEREWETEQERLDYIARKGDKYSKRALAELHKERIRKLQAAMDEESSDEEAPPEKKARTVSPSLAEEEEPPPPPKKDEEEIIELEEDDDYEEEEEPPPPKKEEETQASDVEAEEEETQASDVEAEEEETQASDVEAEEEETHASDVEAEEEE